MLYNNMTTLTTKQQKCGQNNHRLRRLLNLYEIAIYLGRRLFDKHDLWLRFLKWFHIYISPSNFRLNSVLSNTRKFGDFNNMKIISK